MASMMDQFEQETSRSYRPQGRVSVDLDSKSASGLVDVRVPDTDVPIFNKQRVNYSPPDPITHFAVCNNFLVMALSTNILRRINLEKMDQVDDVEITRAVEDKVYRLFLDPTGRHVIVSMVSLDNLYLSRNSKKPKSIGKLKGHLIDSVGWNWHNVNDSTTGAILIGTHRGLIFETEINAVDDGRLFSGTLEQYIKQLFNVGKEKPTPVTGIVFDQLVSNNKADYRYYIMATTPGRLYHFVGCVSTTSPPPMFAAMFQEYDPEKVEFQEIPQNFGYSELQLFYPKFRERAKSFAWMTGPGIYHGDIDSKAVTDSFIVNAKLMYHDEEGVTPSDKVANPVSICLTEFHVLVLFPDRLRAYCTLNQQPVYETTFRPGNMLGVCKDPITGFIFVFSPSVMFRYKVTRETRDVWQMYLDQGDFEKAKEYCKDNPINKDKVLTKQANLLFKNKQYEKSALMYADTQTSFEEITLQFISLEDKSPLKTFLGKKLDSLKKSDKTQITMLVTWLIEIYLNQLGELKEQSGEITPEYESLQEQFRWFLNMDKIRECVTTNRSTIYDQIASHGHIEDMVFFAKLMKDFERVIGYRIQHDDYSGALDILTKQPDLDLYYKFSPLLMQYIPHETVNAWIDQGRRLEPKRLIPALVQYDALKYKEQGNEAIRYLEFCINRLDNKDEAIHNYLLSLYTQLQPEALMRYLHLQGQDVESLCYDIKFALRLCAEHDLKEACVHIYSVMGLYEEAVDLALSVNVDLAKLQADKPDENDDELRKKLWLRIARHVVEEERDVKRAMAFLHDCELLKIEDVLPFFPDFVTIDHFKEAIIQSLVEYHQHIDSLKDQMEEATVSAEEIRKEIHSFRNKYTFVKTQDKCSSCNFPILTRTFYIFPCQHKFHNDCLVTEILPYLTPNVRLKVEETRRQLSEMDDRRQSTVSVTTPGTPILSKEQALKNELDEIVAAECKFCGDIMIRSIDEPFVDSANFKAVMDSWL